MGSNGVRRRTRALSGRHLRPWGLWAAGVRAWLGAHTRPSLRSGASRASARATKDCTSAINRENGQRYIGIRMNVRAQSASPWLGWTMGDAPIRKHGHQVVDEDAYLGQEMTILLVQRVNGPSR